MDMYVNLLMNMRVCMEPWDTLAETQKVTGYWNLVMQQMVVINTL